MHFLYLTLAGLAGLLTLLVTEFGYKRRWWHGEAARKFAHMAIGLQVAVWPLFLHWYEIRLIALALVIGLVISLRFGLFKSLRSVQRRTWGELAFISTFGLLTFVTTSEAIYAAAILHLTVADGLAALVGTRFGKRNSYKILRHTKSWAGTAVFLGTSLAILVGYSLLSVAGLSWYALAVTAVTATLLENIGVYGLDNVLVPAYVVAMLTLV